MTPSSRSPFDVRWLVALAAAVLGVGVGVALDPPVKATAVRPAAAHQVEGGSSSSPVVAVASPPAQARPVDQRFSATFVAATPDSVTVQGIGTLQGTPDVAIVNLQVDVQRPTSGAALDAANAVVARVIRSLRKHGVAAADVQSTGLSLSPAYTYREDRSPELAGYQAGQSITAKLRSAGKRGGTISAAVAVAPGDVTINGLSYDLEQGAALLSGAQRKAFAAARKKALEYAELAGRHLGRVMTITEGTTPTSGGPVSFPGLGGSGAAAAADVPLAAGSQGVSVVVTVTWALR
jgi:uncharacterized protein YggE